MNTIEQKDSVENIRSWARVHADRMGTGHTALVLLWQAFSKEAISQGMTQWCGAKLEDL